MSEYKLDFLETGWTEAANGARFKAFERDDKTIRLVEFSGAFEEIEWCEKAHTGYVVEGDLEIDFGTEKVSYSQGDGIFIPPGTKHKAKHLSEKVLLFLVEEI
ncbi:MAG: cupin domain-containing protein [Pyrinomonadaceae bacterium]